MQPQGTLSDMHGVRIDSVMRFMSPQRVVSELNLWRGDHVLDYDSGVGHFVPHIRAAVGEDGRVYVHNAHEGCHTAIIRDTVARGQREIVPIFHAFNDELIIDAGTLDAVVFANVLSKEAVSVEAVLAEALRIIRREGKLCVVDFQTHATSKSELIALLADFNFVPRRELSSHAVGAYHYGIIFAKT